MMNCKSNGLTREIVEEICDRSESISYHPLPTSVIDVGAKHSDESYTFKD